MNKTIKTLIATAIGFVVGLGLGFVIGQKAETVSGAYFCCDRQDVCVLAGPDCSGTLKWCEKTGTSPAGNTICEQW